MCSVRHGRGVGEHIHHIAILLTKTMLRAQFFHLDGKVRVHALALLIRGIGWRKTHGGSISVGTANPEWSRFGGDHAHGDLAHRCL